MPFDSLIPDAQRFCRGLAANNTKEWWDANKARYDSTLKAPALQLLAALAPRLQDLTGDPVGEKLFRPHRDVRFSADKRPYKEHLHMLWSVKAGGRQEPAFFFGIGVDYVTVGAGIMGFDKPVLEDWRKFVDLDAKRIGPMVTTLRDKGFSFWEPELKRVPAGFDPDHPLSDLMRMKGAVCSAPLGDGEGPLEDRIMEGFVSVKPFVDLLTSVACA
ncbi:MAG: TIGR02453 family protein [Rhodobacteraceae bacterium]|nr:TIGR02453 family protein [Paracoccaceae bacterium]